MEKEKIVLGNGTELPFDNIGFQGDNLVIGFIGGDAAELESMIRAAGQDNLEHIRQLDATGNEQTTHNWYDIFKAVNKRIDAAALDDGSTADVVEIILAVETETDAKIRHLEQRMASTEEVADTLLMAQLS